MDPVLSVLAPLPITTWRYQARRRERTFQIGDRLDGRFRILDRRNEWHIIRLHRLLSSFAFSRATVAPCTFKSGTSNVATASLQTPVKRRTVLRLACAAVAAMPLLAHGQDAGRVRRVAILMNLSETDPQSQAQLAAFGTALQKAGWTVGRNVQIDYRWTEGKAEKVRKYGADLIALSPDVVFTVGASHVGLLEQLTHTIPIVFVQVTDPVGGGLVDSLAHPGGNATGFTVFEYDISAKWLEVLKKIAPRLERVAVLRDPSNPSGTGLFGGIQAVASTFGVEASPIGLRDAGQIERGVTAFAGPNNGLIVTPSSFALVYRDLIVKLAAQYRLPTIYPFGYFVIGGGLVSYGPDVVDQFKRAAGYVDRILKGEKPADLPVQRSSKLETMVNLRTATALGISIPQDLILRADNVVQ